MGVCKVKMRGKKKGKQGKREGRMEMFVLFVASLTSNLHSIINTAYEE